MHSNVAPSETPLAGGAAFSAEGGVASSRANDRLLTTEQLAEWLNRSAQALKVDRLLCRGVPYIRVGSRQVRYRVSDVEAFLEKNLHGSTDSA